MRLIDAEHMGSDNDIIKALECCVTSNGCPDCPMLGERNCMRKKDAHSLCLVNRQKEEIERLETELQAMRGAANSLKMHLQTARAEAIKEFAERLKQTRADLYGIEMVAVGNIDAIAEQMTEE